MSPVALTFLTNLRFEARAQLRTPTIYICTFLLFLYWLIFAARMKMDPNFWGSAGEVKANAPVVYYFVFCTQAFVAFLFVPLVMSYGPLRDRQAGVAQAWMAAPISPKVALWGRFSAAFGLLACATFIASLGVLLSPYLRIALGKDILLDLGPIAWSRLIHAWFVLVLPTLFFASNLVFWLVARSQKLSTSAASTLFLVLAASVAHYFGETLHFEVLQIIDPSAFHAVHRSVAYWSIAERNHDFLPLTQPLIYNRLLWLSLGAGAYLLFHLQFERSRFLFGQRTKHQRRPLRHTKDERHPARDAQARKLGQSRPATALTILLSRVRRELLQIIQNRSFTAVLVLSLLWLWGQQYGALELAFTKPQATAQVLVAARKGLWMMTFYFLPFVCATTVFYERQIPGWQHFDALDLPNWLHWLPKLIAIFAYTSCFPLAVCITGVLTQLTYGHLALDWRLYAETLVFSYFPYLVQLAAISFSIATLSPSRTIAYGITMLVLYASIFVYETSGIDQALWLQMHETIFSSSAFTGLQAYQSKILSKSVFWVCVSFACLLAATQFWPRGNRRRTSNRLHYGQVGLALALAITATLVYRYNQSQTRRWNHTRLRPDTLARKAKYEREVSTLPTTPVALASPIQIDLDLRPQRKEYRSDWKAELDEPLDQGHQFLVHTPLFSQPKLEIASAELQPTLRFPELGTSVYITQNPQTTALPQSIRVTNTHVFEGHPFKRDKPLGVLAHGTFLGQDALPAIGYQEAIEITTPLDRRSFGLAEQPTTKRQPSSKSRDCPWTLAPQTWKIHLSTSADEYAVAPGKLERVWTEGTRKHFLYRSQRPTCSYFSFASAKYKALDAQWTSKSGASVDIRVLSTPDHASAAADVLIDVQSALDFLSTALGPYPYSTLQVAEARRDANLDISPANTLWLREHEGWAISKRHANNSHERLFFIVRRLAQHWTHNQLAPSDAPGRAFFNQALPSFLAHEFLNDRFGRQWTKRHYVVRAMRRYFWYHGAHAQTELPVLESTNRDHVHGYKGALALRAYASTLGRGALFSALREFVGQGPARQAPRPVDLLKGLESLHQDSSKPSLPQEMLTQIVHYNNRLLSASATRSDLGGYVLRLKLRAERWMKRRDGAKPELVEWVRPLPIQVHTRQPNPKAPPERFRVTVHNGTQDITLRTRNEPLDVHIDPEMHLLDVSLKDQAKRVELHSEPTFVR